MARKAKAAEEPSRRYEGNKKGHPPHHAPTQAAAAAAATATATAVMETAEASSEVCFYDTLPGLTLDFSPEEALDGAEPQPSSYLAAAAEETYAVFRNEITAAGDAIGDIPAADFFSLDVSADAKAVPASPSSAAVRPTGAVTPSSSCAKMEQTAQPAQGSERAWFRGGRRFRSPMLQLHKG
jgi:non-canonical poly(A) RNA polymerase PAPD5/7